MAFAPLVVEDAALGVGVLLAFMAFVCAIALRAGWSATFGLLFSEVAKAMHKIPAVPIPFHSFKLGDWLAAPFETANNLVYAALGALIQQTEHAWHLVIRKLAYVVTATSDEMAALAEDTLRAYQWYAHKVQVGTLWKEIKPLVDHHSATLPATKVIIRPATKTAVDHYPQLAARVGRLEKEAARAGTKAIAVTVPGVAIPRTKAPAKTRTAVLNPPRVGEIDRALDWTKGQIGKLRKTLTVAGIVGLTAAALGRLGLGWTRCARVNKTGKALCGMDNGLLDSLLADTLLIVGTVSLVEFAVGMQEVTKEIVGPVRTFWRVT